MMDINGADWPQNLLLNAERVGVSRRREVEIDIEGGILIRDHELVIINKLWTSPGLGLFDSWMKGYFADSKR